MDSDKPSGKRFRDDMLKPKKRPKLCLPLLVAARHYKEKIAATVKARRALVVEAMSRAAGHAAALTMLNCLAAEFDLAPFNQTDIDKAMAGD